MSDVYYARPITVTDERMRDALEKQAKQRALRDALDSQVQSRVSVSSQNATGLTRVQQKRLELQQFQQEQQQVLSPTNNNNYGGYPPPPAGASASSSAPMPPNYALGSSFSFGGVPLPPRPYEQQHQQQQQQPVYAQFHNYNHQQQQQQQQQQQFNGESAVVSPTTVRALHNPNFNLAEVYAQQQQQQMPLHAPARDLPVPLSPRQVTNRSPGTVGGGRQLTNSEVIRASIDYANGTSGGGVIAAENVQNILRLAKKITDNPPMGTSAGIPNNSAYLSNEGMNALRDVGGGLPPSRTQSKDAKTRNASTPVVDRNQKKDRVQETRVEKLQRELQDRQHEMQRMRDKERDWEDQVKQLKSELKNARQKERDLSKMVQEKPQRAETAPNTGSVSKLVPLQDKRAVAGKGDLRPSHPSGQAQGRVHGDVGGNPQRKDFNNAKVFSSETFRPITAPLDPIDDIVRTSTQQQLPPLPESLKMASFNTRKVAFGLQQTVAPIPMTYEQLCDFVKSQVITQQQAELLWTLFSGSSETQASAMNKKPSPPPGSRPRDPPRRSVPDSPTYETYEDLADDDDGGYDYEQ